MGRDLDAQMKALAPYQYQLVYALLVEPLSAYELTCQWPWRDERYPTTPQAMAGRLRPLVQRGWITLNNGIYRITPKGRQSISW